MEDVRALTEAERSFFSFLADTIFSNPFNHEEAKNDARLAEFIDTKTIASRITSKEALLPLLEERLRILNSDGISHLERIKTDDRPLLEYAILFQIYHHFLDDFDELIEKQNQSGTTPVSVGFAKTLLGLLHSSGFNKNEALRYIAIFYQLRRAFYFIENSLIGDSSPMQSLRRSLWRNVFTADMRAYGDLFWNRMEDFSTLLLGETGTGKGTAAAAIGRSGLIPFDPQANRFQFSFNETFIATNLSQFPESLIESELFGHRKGAFTGAVANHVGLFERCSPHGALFLDEIGELAPPVQIKLLNVLQERNFSPVGSHDRFRFAGRVIAATNKKLSKLRRKQNFRDDFFYRLSSDIIEVPPLRTRIEASSNELAQLVSLIVSRMAGQKSAAFESRILEILTKELPKNYPWPGNVRELEQAIRRIILTGRYLGTEEDQAMNSYLQQISRGELTTQALLTGYYKWLYQQLGSYEAVAKRTGVDRRTVRKYIDEASL
jgi:DNA-binding NtrC family response regulator